MEPPISEKNTIWTIGHSTRTTENFINLLKIYNIELLADIRSYPGSKRYPHFNKNSLDISLAGNQIEYIHIPELGGKRKPAKDSHHTEWKNASFRAYADHMDSDTFYKGITILRKISGAKRTALMCAEALWRHCHRRLVSDYLSSRGTKVIHIIDDTRTEIHSELTPDENAENDLFGRNAETV